MAKVAYQHLIPGKAPPRWEGPGSFKAILVIEYESSKEWQSEVSDWLVKSGCRYLMAWGHKCSEWHDSVDEANLRLFDYGEVPEDEFVMTTWHDHEPLKDVFWYSAHAAMHPSLDLGQTYIVHIASTERSTELLQVFHDALDASAEGRARRP